MQGIWCLFIGYYAGYNDICEKISYLPNWWANNRNDFPRNRIIKFFIHPDCHEIFKPQVKDLVIQRGNIRLHDKIGTIAPGSRQKDIFFIEADYMDDAKAHEGAAIHRLHISKIEILQRSGKAWFTPEVEK